MGLHNPRGSVASFEVGEWWLIFDRELHAIYDMDINIVKEIWWHEKLKMFFGVL